MQAKQDGRDAIADAVASTYARFGARGLRFKPIGSPVGHHQALKFGWEMFNAETGEVDSIGTTFLLLNLDNLIERDYQFTEETSDANNTVWSRRRWLGKGAERRRWSFGRCGARGPVMREARPWRRSSSRSCSSELERG
jgi:hypothetical protein